MFFLLYLRNFIPIAFSLLLSVYILNLYIGTGEILQYDTPVCNTVLEVHFIEVFTLQTM